MVNNSKKVAIVGAGVIGLYLAWKLSQRGHQVKVLEAKREIGKDSCSGLISNKILDFIPQADQFTENKIRQAKINVAQKTITLTFSDEILAINRVELDQKLAELARDAGAEIELNHFVQEIPQDYDLVIGCDGAHSQVRRRLGLNDLNYRLGIRGFIDQQSSQSSEGVVETWPVHRGLIWKIPRADKTEYGIIAPVEEASQELQEFLEEREIELSNIASDLIGRGLKMGTNDKVAICGEAAGLTKKWSGGGVIWGLTAANLLLENFPNLRRYRSEVKSFFKNKIILSDLITGVVYNIGFNAPWLLPKNTKIESDYLLS